MKDYLKSVGVQMTSIILAALIAGLLAFIQSLTTQAGACPNADFSPEQVGLIGGVVKGAHSVFLLSRTKIYI